MKLVNQIFSLIQSNTGIPACDPDTDKNICATVKGYEQRIDCLVYKLYNLDYEEVKIVDPEFAISKENYENAKLITTNDAGKIEDNNRNNTHL